MQRALKSGEVPCLLEPPGCSRPDGKKPDGLSLIPWAKGKSLLWDYTCADTFALSYINKTAKEVGWAAKHAERKNTNITSICESNFFLFQLLQRRPECLEKKQSN